MDISVHDNRLISYCVVRDKREIRLHTIYEDHEPYEYTDVIFFGVVAYHFEQDSFETIIFDIDEMEATAIHTENRERFEDGRKYGWPGVWNTSEQAVLKYFVSSGVKGFALSSSCGMSGWVMAQEMTKVSVATSP